MPARPRALKRVFSDARVWLPGAALGHLHGRVERRLLQVHAGGVVAAEVQALAALQRTQGACSLDRRAADQRVLNRRSKRMCFGSARRRWAHDLNTWTLPPEADFSCRAPSQALPSQLRPSTPAL